MLQDEIVEEVRKNRESLFKEFQYDEKKLFQYLHDIQKEYKNRLITKPINRIEHVKI